LFNLKLVIPSMLFACGIAALSVTFLWPSKKSNQRNSRLRSDPMNGSALAGSVGAGSALMPIFFGERLVVLAFFKLSFWSAAKNDKSFIKVSTKKRPLFAGRPSLSN